MYNVNFFVTLKYIYISFSVPGQMIHPDPPVNNNPQRVQFCEKYEDLPLFCDGNCYFYNIFIDIEFHLFLNISPEMIII